MKRLYNLLGGIMVIVTMVAGIFVFSTRPVSAFNNFTTNGGTTVSGSGGGSSGSVGTLQQVTTAGATTNVESSFTGGLLFSNATGTLLSLGVGSSTVPSLRSIDPDSGIYWDVTGQNLIFLRNGGNVAAIDSNGFSLQGGNDLRSNQNGTSDIGTAILSMGTIYASGTASILGPVSIGTAGAGAITFTGGASGQPGLAIDSFTSGVAQIRTSSGSDRVLRVINTDATSVLNLEVEGYVTATRMGVGDGTAAAPSLFFNSAPQNGWLQTTSGTMAYVTNGVNRIQISTASGVIISQNLLPESQANVRNIGAANLSFNNFFSSGTFNGVQQTMTGAEIVLSGLAAPAATADFTCYSATGTLRHQAASCTVSSIRFKEHVEAMNDEEIMAKVRKLRGVTFDWKEETNSTGLLGTPKDEGFIAEEVAQIDPYLVVWEKVANNDSGLKLVQSLYPGVAIKKDDGWMIPKTVDYPKMSVFATTAIQNVDKRLIALEKRVSVIDRILNFLGFNRFAK